MHTIVRVLIAAAAPACALALAPSVALAKVHIAVDLDTQTIHVESKERTFDWKVSSGKTGYDTPAGTFKVLWMDKDHHSDEYEQAYMPYAIFFAPGFAIHGFAKSPWGHKASHGCIRLPLDKAAVLFDLVKAEGADIAVVGVSNREAPTVAEAERKRRNADTASAAPDRARTVMKRITSPRQGARLVPPGTIMPTRTTPRSRSSQLASARCSAASTDPDRYGATVSTRRNRLSIQPTTSMNSAGS